MAGGVSSTAGWKRVYGVLKPDICQVDSEPTALTWSHDAERHVEMNRIMYSAIKAIPKGMTSFTNNSKIAPNTTRVLKAMELSANDLGSKH